MYAIILFNYSSHVAIFYCSMKLMFEIINKKLFPFDLKRLRKSFTLDKVEMEICACKLKTFLSSFSDDVNDVLLK